MQVEIPEFLYSDQIVRTARALQKAVLYRPTACLGGINARPSFEILAVKQRDRFSLNPAAIVVFIDLRRRIANEGQISCGICRGTRHHALETAVDVLHCIFGTVFRIRSDSGTTR